LDFAIGFCYFQTSADFVTLSPGSLIGEFRDAVKNKTKKMGMRLFSLHLNPLNSLFIRTEQHLLKERKSR
jgi:hypothetical protein